MKKFLSIIALALVMFIILIMATACSALTDTKPRAWDNEYNHAIIVIDGTVYAEGHLDAIAVASNDDTLIDIIIDGKPYCTHSDNILFSWKGE